MLPSELPEIFVAQASEEGGARPPLENERAISYGELEPRPWLQTV
jgi:hypothetical protein